MNKKLTLHRKKIWSTALVLTVWAFTVWLLYPLFTIRSLEEWDPTAYTLRAILGIGILILFFGKTIFDLFFPLDTSKGMSWLQTIFLAVYSALLAVGILYLAGRLIVLYFKAQNSDLFF